MNIPDEYFTDDAPTQYGAYAIKHANGRTSVTSFEPGDDRKLWELLNPGARFCALAPQPEVAEVEILIKENEALHSLLADAEEELGMMEMDVERLKAENEKLRGWVKEAYGEGACSTAHWEISVTKARLEGKEP